MQTDSMSKFTTTEKTLNIQQRRKVFKKSLWIVAWDGRIEGNNLGCDEQHEQDDRRKQRQSTRRERRGRRLSNDLEQGNKFLTSLLQEADTVAVSTGRRLARIAFAYTPRFHPPFTELLSINPKANVNVKTTDLNSRPLAYRYLPQIVMNCTYADSRNACDFVDSQALVGDFGQRLPSVRTARNFRLT